MPRYTVPVATDIPKDISTWRILKANWRTIGMYHMRLRNRISTVASLTINRLVALEPVPKDELHVTVKSEERDP